MLKIFFSSSCILLTSTLFSVTNVDTPQQGLERLLKGNDRYVHDNLEHPNRTPERREALVNLQTPFATIIGCADSRVTPEIVFDQGVGDLFVVRVAGNVVGPLELDSIEYSVLYLNSKVILVMGHENCGAVDAVIKGTTKDIESVAELIQPAVTEAKKMDSKNILVTSIKKNAINMRDYLRRSPALQKYINEKKIEIYAGYYNLQSGTLEILKN
jgi:carbonic anhydrase